MRCRLIAATCAVLQFMAPFVIGGPIGGSPTTLIDWTYAGAYTYVVERHGVEHPIASLIARHIATSTRAWQDVYQNDITIDGGILTLPDRGHPDELQKRQQNNPYIQVFPFTDTCGGDLSITKSISTQSCVIPNYPYGIYSVNIMSFRAYLGLGPCSGYNLILHNVDTLNCDEGLSPQNPPMLTDDPMGNCISSQGWGGLGWGSIEAIWNLAGCPGAPGEE